MTGLHPEERLIYHITDVANLPGILADGRLHSDKIMSERVRTVIGYDHIKKRRLQRSPFPARAIASSRVSRVARGPRAHCDGVPRLGGVRGSGGGAREGRVELRL